MIISLIGGVRVIRRTKQDIPELALVLLAHRQGRVKASPFQYKNKSYVKYSSKSEFSYVLLAEDWLAIEEALSGSFPIKRNPAEGHIADHKDPLSYARIVGLLERLIVDSYPHR